MGLAMVIVGHGSRDSQANAEFARLVRMVRRKSPHSMVAGAYLELARPSIGEVITRCIRRGATRITVLPAILVPAGHARRDIPNEVQKAQRAHPAVEFLYAPPLGLHDDLLELAQRRIEDALVAIKDRRTAPVLVVVGRGSSDGRANREVDRLARSLRARLGIRDAIACYLDLAAPLLPDALQWAGQKRGKPIVVFPFFLFTGVLEKRVRRLSMRFARGESDQRLIVAGYLGPDPFLRDALLDRAREARPLPAAP